MGAQGLTVHAASFEGTRHMLARAIERADTTGGACSIEDMCASAQAFEVRQDGQPVAAYALNTCEHSGGRVTWVAAAGGGAAGLDLTAQVMDTVIAQARSVQAGQLAITTRRRGLIKKLRALGFEVSGITLRKKI